MCKSHTKKIGALKLSQQDVGKNCFFRGCAKIFVVFVVFLLVVSRNESVMTLGEGEEKERKNISYLSLIFFYFLF